ncbi:RhuM family protein [Holdemanella biformis]|uniref:RhuM family protein n=1 Tax=Holdemanella biformis TaxID=1735 RepID=UPI003F657BDF
MYSDEELFKEATCSKMEQVQMEGSRKMDFYNLDAIVAVGYRVNSKKATSFRRWATSILKKYMIKNIRMISEVPLYSVVFQYLYYSYKRLCKRYSGSSFD